MPYAVVRAGVAALADIAHEIVAGVPRFGGLETHCLYEAMTLTAETAGVTVDQPLTGAAEIKVFFVLVYYFTACSAVDSFLEARGDHSVGGTPLNVFNLEEFRMGWALVTLHFDFINRQDSFNEVI